MTEHPPSDHPNNSPSDHPSNSPSNFKLLITRPIYFLAWGMGTGLLPKAPGTAGSVLAVVLFILLGPLPVSVHLILVIAAFALGLLICGRVAEEMGHKDPSSIVWDEFVGIWITLVLLPPGWYWLAIAFLLFRLFDIAKPWPINLIDARVAGGLGIMLDDVIAGAYALAIIQLAYYLTT